MKIQINKPIVKRQIRGVEFIRNGRGFSKSELKEAGIDIPVDLLRNKVLSKAYCKGYLKFEKNSRKGRLTKTHVKTIMLI